MTATANPQAPAQPSAKKQARLALWARVKDDYLQALAIARGVWPPQTPPEVIQSATATILIHEKELQKLLQQPRGPNNGTKGQPPTQAMAPKACPDCNGPMYDNRNDKKGPRSPDFRCKDPECNKAVWLTPPKGGKKKSAPAPAPSGGYDDYPEQLEEEDDDLPF